MRVSGGLRPLLLPDTILCEEGSGGRRDWNPDLIIPLS